MKLIDILKKNKTLKRIVTKYKMKKEFINDYNFFINNYSHSSETSRKLEYNMILVVHSLEKGMTNLNPRKFGYKKVIELIDYLNQYSKYDEKSYAYNLSISMLNEYLRFYESHNWVDSDEYRIVSNYIQNKHDYKKIAAGKTEIYKDEILKECNKINYDDFLSSRHAVRCFSKEKLKKEDIKNAVSMAIKSPSACNRQMIKVNYIENQDKINFIKENSQGLGNFELDNVNFFVITFDINANYFIGERNQGWFNAGLFSMNFVNALHSLGIGSCFLQFGSSFKKECEFKKVLNIPNSERIAVIIAAGYYAEKSVVPCSARKDLNDILQIK